MCSGLPTLPDSQEPWALLPPPGLVTALLAMGMGDSLVGKACSVKGSQSVPAHWRMTEQTDWGQQPDGKRRERLARRAGRL